MSRFFFKTISVSLPVKQAPLLAQSSVAVVDPTAPAIPVAAPVVAPSDPPATAVDAGQEPPVQQQSGVSTSSRVTIPPSASAAGNDTAFVTVAPSINITSNGIYAAAVRPVAIHAVVDQVDLAAKSSRPRKVLPSTSTTWRRNCRNCIRRPGIHRC